MPLRTLSPTIARRLAITRQRLAGSCSPVDAAGILDIVHDLGCLQLDPTSAVARSHLLVLWSRLGPYDSAHLDTLLWQERRLFEYWAHAASIVLTDDYPIHQALMRRYALGDSAWDCRVRAWMEANESLQSAILAQLRAMGPQPSRAFADTAGTRWSSSGWTGGRNVDRMLTFLWIKGVIMVAGRSGGQRIWDVAERCLPPWTPREPWPESEVVLHAAQKSLRALGVARADHIEQHYVQGRYPGLADALAELEAAGRIVRVQIGDVGHAWPGSWYLHADEMPLLERLETGDWQPRTTLLSPFDNLICNRRRTEMLFNFTYRLEIYVPRAKRRYGYYVLPILHGDRLIGRIDPTMDRKRKRLTINAVYAEPDAPMTVDVARAVVGAIEDLGRFLGAKDIVYGQQVPAAWGHVLH